MLAPIVTIQRGDVSVNRFPLLQRCFIFSQVILEYAGARALYLSGDNYLPVSR